MRYGKMVLGAVVILVGLVTSAEAQQFGVGGFGGNAFAGNAGGFGFNNLGYNSGYGGGIGFKNGTAYQGGYYSNGLMPYYQAPFTTYNNLGGLANSLSTQTGKANSYRYGYGQRPAFRRR